MGHDEHTLRPAEVLFLALLLFLSVAIIYMSYKISGFSSFSSPGAFPLFVGVVMLFSCIMSLRETRKGKKSAYDTQINEISAALKILFPGKMMIFTLMIITYGYFLGSVGFLISTSCFLWVSMVYLKGATSLKAIWITILNVSLTYAVFRYIFLVLLP